MEISVREALNQAIDEELARDNQVFVIGEEVGRYHGAYKVTQGLIDKYSDKRIVDTPIAESGFAGLGIGAAMVGLRPIVEFMTWNFSLVAIDQLINNAAKMRYMSGGQIKLAIVFRGPQGAGGYLGAQHSQIFENYYIYMPGLKVIAPSTPYSFKGLLKTAVRDENPVIFLESEKIYAKKGEVPQQEYLIPFGKANIAQEGTDVTIVSWSLMHYVVQEAIIELKKSGISVEHIDLLSLKPLDMETLVSSIKKTNHLVIVQESWLSCSMGEHIANMINQTAFDYLDAPIEIVSSSDRPMPYSFHLEDITLPSAPNVVEVVHRVLR